MGEIKEVVSNTNSKSADFRKSALSLIPPTKGFSLVEIMLE